MIAYVWLNCLINSIHQNIYRHIFPSDSCVICDISEENLAYLYCLYMWMGRWLTGGKGDIEEETEKKNNNSADLGLN